MSRPQTASKMRIDETPSKDFSKRMKTSSKKEVEQMSRHLTALLMNPETKDALMKSTVSIKG